MNKCPGVTSILRMIPHKLEGEPIEMHINKNLNKVAL